MADDGTTRPRTPDQVARADSCRGHEWWRELIAEPGDTATDDSDQSDETPGDLPGDLPGELPGDTVQA